MGARCPTRNSPRCGGCSRPRWPSTSRSCAVWPDLVARLGPGPAWTRYHGGPWPLPHDPIFDFSRTPEGWEWLDAFAAAATADLAQSDAGTPVVAHGDWYVGNVRVEDDRVVAVFDWDFVVEPEPVVVGLSAGGLLLEGAPSPADVAAFVDDYAQVCPTGLDEAQRRVAAAAARWVLAFNARCDLAMLSGEPDPPRRWAGCSTIARRMVVHAVPGRGASPSSSSASWCWP